MVIINDNATDALADPSQTPYVLVVLQELTRMNVLLGYMSTSLNELEKGLNGELNMSEAMEHLGDALGINQVPGRNPFHKTSWEALAVSEHSLRR